MGLEPINRVPWHRGFLNTLILLYHIDMLYSKRCKLLHIKMDIHRLLGQKGHLPARPGKHAVPPDKTTVLNQSGSPANSAEWQWSIQRATAWCKPIACLHQEVHDKLNLLFRGNRKQDD